LELSRSTWLITSLLPGAARRCRSTACPPGHLRAVGALSELRQKAFTRTGKSFPIIVIQEAGLDGFWITACCRTKGSKATSSIRLDCDLTPARRAKTDRIDGETAASHVAGV